MKDEKKMLKAIFQAVILGKSIHNTSLKELPKNDHVKNIYFVLGFYFMIPDHVQFHFVLISFSIRMNI